VVDSGTWDLIHRERSAVADMLGGLTPEQWNQRSLCGDWSVRMAAAHIVAGAEQTTPHFLARLVASGLRFNSMIDVDAHRMGELSPDEIERRLRARTATTNHPPGPVMAMLGEVVVHGEDIRRALGIIGSTPPEAVTACLDMFSSGNFPVGGKRRVAGLRLVSSDVDWSHGSGPEVTGPGMALLVAMTGRREGADELSGDGVATLSGRMPVT
jgi:uncharacterized protein (TIGR03083 family)